MPGLEDYAAAAPLNGDAPAPPAPEAALAQPIAQSAVLEPGALPQTAAPQAAFQAMKVDVLQPQPAAPPASAQPVSAMDVDAPAPPSYVAPVSAEHALGAPAAVAPAQAAAVQQSEAAAPLPVDAVTPAHVGAHDSGDATPSELNTPPPQEEPAPLSQAASAASFMPPASHPPAPAPAAESAPASAPSNGIAQQPAPVAPAVQGNGTGQSGNQADAIMGSLGNAPGAPTLATTDRPSPSAVAPERETVLSPVKVDGQQQHASAPTLAAPADRAEGGAAPAMISSIDAAHAEEAKRQIPSSDDVVMSDAAPASSAAQATDSSSQLNAAAPAPGASSETRPAEPTEEEPPSKRQRKSEAPESKPVAAPAAASAPAPAAAAPTSAAPAPAAAPNATPQLAKRDAVDMTPAQIRFAQSLVKSLLRRVEASAFAHPVDPVALGIPHYPTIITRPMDFATVDMKLAITSAAAQKRPSDKVRRAHELKLDPARDFYATPKEFENDVRLIFKNCRTFNGPDHNLSHNANVIEKSFDAQIGKMPTEAAPIAPASSSSLDAGRPKREIHPPSRDLPWTDEPGSGSARKARRKSGPAMTQRQKAYHANVKQQELKFCLKVIDEILTQQTSQTVAWVFNELPARDLEFAPAYYQLITKPISLKMIQAKLKRNEYADAAGFEADMDLLFKNCYLFNPKDSDVWKMGQKTQSIFREKLSRMPKPAPFSPGPEDEEEEEDYEDEEEDDEDEQAKILAQIAMLQAQLQNKGKPGKASASKNPKKRRQSDAAVGPAAKKAPTKKPKPSTAASTTAEAAPKKPRTSNKKASTKKSGGGGAESDDDIRRVSYEQKEELAQKIMLLPDDRLDGALKIISEDKPPNTATDDEEIELDIDDLSPRTLYRLYRYVVRPKHKKPAKGTAVDGRKRGTGGVKRKNLDEGEEAARIARLQEQLSQFDNAESGAAATSSSAAPAGAHDDHVDSSSEEGSDEESESDYE